MPEPPGISPQTSESCQQQYGPCCRQKGIKRARNKSCRSAKNHSTRVDADPLERRCSESGLGGPSRFLDRISSFFDTRNLEILRLSPESVPHRQNSCPPGC